MAESLAGWFVDTLNGVPPELIIFIISMIPILELRGGIIAAALLKVDYLTALPICLIGNFIPLPFILLLIKSIFKWMKNHNILKNFIEKLEAKSTSSKSDRIRKYEFTGLLLFVGIPLPGTGGWTGSLIAALLNVDFKKAIVAIILGLLLAAAIMSFISYGIPYLVSVM